MREKATDMSNHRGNVEEESPQRETGTIKPAVCKKMVGVPQIKMETITALLNDPNSLYDRFCGDQLGEEPGLGYDDKVAHIITILSADVCLKRPFENLTTIMMAKAMHLCHMNPEDIKGLYRKDNEDTKKLCAALSMKCSIRNITRLYARHQGNRELLQKAISLTDRLMREKATYMNIREGNVHKKPVHCETGTTKPVACVMTGNVSQFTMEVVTTLLNEPSPLYDRFFADQMVEIPNLVYDDKIAHIISILSADDCVKSPHKKLTPVMVAKVMHLCHVNPEDTNGSFIRGNEIYEKMCAALHITYTFGNRRSLYQHHYKHRELILKAFSLADRLMREKATYMSSHRRSAQEKPAQRETRETGTLKPAVCKKRKPFVLQQIMEIVTALLNEPSPLYDRFFANQMEEIPNLAYDLNVVAHIIGILSADDCVKRPHETLTTIMVAKVMHLCHVNPEDVNGRYCKGSEEYTRMCAALHMSDNIANRMKIFAHNYRCRELILKAFSLADRLMREKATYKNCHPGMELAQRETRETGTLKPAVCEKMPGVQQALLETVTALLNEPNPLYDRYCADQLGNDPGLFSDDKATHIIGILSGDDCVKDPRDNLTAIMVAKVVHLCQVNSEEMSSYNKEKNPSYERMCAALHVANSLRNRKKINMQYNRNWAVVRNAISLTDRLMREKAIYLSNRPRNVQEEPAQRETRKTKTVQPAVCKQAYEHQADEASTQTMETSMKHEDVIIKLDVIKEEEVYTTYSEGNGMESFPAEVEAEEEEQSVQTRSGSDKVIEPGQKHGRVPGSCVSSERLTDDVMSTEIDEMQWTSDDEVHSVSNDDTKLTSYEPWDRVEFSNHQNDVSYESPVCTPNVDVNNRVAEVGYNFRHRAKSMNHEHDVSSESLAHISSGSVNKRKRSQEKGRENEHEDGRGRVTAKSSRKEESPVMKRSKRLALFRSAPVTGSDSTSRSAKEDDGKDNQSATWLQNQIKGNLLDKIEEIQTSLGYDDTLILHLKDKMYECVVCGKKIETLSRLERHLNTHTTEKNDLYSSCGGKSVCFSESPRLIHIPEDQVYKCEMCKRPYSHLFQEQKHNHQSAVESSPSGQMLGEPSCLKRQSTVESSPSGQMLGKPSSLKQQSAVESSPSRQMFGDLSSFKRQNTMESCLGRQMLGDPSSFKQQNNVEYSPSGQMLGDQSSLKRQSTVECSPSRQMLESQSSLKQNIYIKHANEKTYECSTCGKSFALLQTLNFHMRTHMGEKRYDCRMCHMKFSTLSHLRHHINMHMEDKPYKCDLCGEGFTSSSNRNAHAETHY